MRRILLWTVLLTGSPLFAPAEETSPSRSSWAQEAIWYQIFPERFRNGDPKNDPTADYARVPDQAKADWKIMPWIKDWYALEDWEKKLGSDVYATNGFRRYGGDFQGIIDQLDYLNDLGVTALYLNPIFESPSLHKYDSRSFHHADPHFGPDPTGDIALTQGETADPSTWKWTAADKLFLELVRQAHIRGLHLILDGVFNHCATEFFAFADLREKQKDSAYASWFDVHQFDDPATKDKNEFNYAGWWGLKSMPEFVEVNDEKGKKNLHPQVKAYLFAITRRWMDPNGDGDSSDGVDGWRLDVANEVGTGFWAEWNDLVHSIRPQAYTTPEIWVEAPNFIREGKFDGVMNYYAFAMPVKGGLIDATIPIRDFVRLIEERRNKFNWDEALQLQNLFDSHDTDRMPSMIVNRDRPYYAKSEAFAYDAEIWPGSRDKPYLIRKPNEEERKLQRMIVLFQMTYPGAPYLYYGTEAGMWGADDPDDRMPMVWADLKFEPQTLSPGGQPARQDDLNFDSALHHYYRDAIALRKKFPDLVHGKMQMIGAENQSRMFAFARTGTNTLVAVFNRHSEPQTFTFQFGTTDGSAPDPLVPIFVSSSKSADVRSQQKDGKSMITLPGLTGALLQQKPVTQ
jgi:cyclomaltodextrinase